MSNSGLSMNTSFGGINTYDGASNWIVSTNGDIFSCGANGRGQLGNGASGTNTFNSSFSQIDTSVVSGNIVKIIQAYDEGSTFVLTDTGNVYGCGYNVSGQLGINTSGDKYTLQVSYRAVS